MQVVRDLRSPETNVSPDAEPRQKTGLDGLTARPARAALLATITSRFESVRLRAYVGCAELTLGDEAPSRCPFVSAPTWAAPLLTSTPGREQHGSGTGWLRSEPTARLCLVPTPEISHGPRSVYRW